MGGDFMVLARLAGMVDGMCRRRTAERMTGWDDYVWTTQYGEAEQHHQPPHRRAGWG